MGMCGGGYEPEPFEPPPDYRPQAQEQANLQSETNRSEASRYNTSVRQFNAGLGDSFDSALDLGNNIYGLGINDVNSDAFGQLQGDVYRQRSSNAGNIFEASPYGVPRPDFGGGQSMAFGEPISVDSPALFNPSNGLQNGTDFTLSLAQENLDRLQGRYDVERSGFTDLATALGTNLYQVEAAAPTFTMNDAGALAAAQNQLAGVRGSLDVYESPVDRFNLNTYQVEGGRQLDMSNRSQDLWDTIAGLQSQRTEEVQRIEAFRRSQAGQLGQYATDIAGLDYGDDAAISDLQGGVRNLLAGYYGFDSTLNPDFSGRVAMANSLLGQLGVGAATGSAIPTGDGTTPTPAPIPNTYQGILDSYAGANASVDALPDTDLTGLQAQLQQLLAAQGALGGYGGPEDTGALTSSIADAVTRAQGRVTGITDQRAAYGQQAQDLLASYQGASFAGIPALAGPRQAEQDLRQQITGYGGTQGLDSLNSLQQYLAQQQQGFEQTNQNTQASDLQQQQAIIAGLAGQQVTGAEGRLDFVSTSMFGVPFNQLGPREQSQVRSSAGFSAITV